jgi:hypothetical protein
METKRKFIESKKIDDYEVLTDTGWVNINAIHKTIKYDVCHLFTNKFELLCADNHIVFKNGKEEYVINLSKGDILDSMLGPTEVISIERKGVLENMYDLELDYESNKRYYTNGILSHNTSYIRYLATKLKKNIIFISSDMVESITDPSFIPFLMQNNDAILIIEDAEPALEKRGNGGRSSAVSNVLNLTDGLLSDCLKISIVATFNTKEKNIDEALMRKGRLLMNYKFERLQLDKTKNLLKKLGYDETEVKEPMTLADIYYYGTDNNTKKTNQKKIGFGN